MVDELGVNTSAAGAGGIKMPGVASQRQLREKDKEIKRLRD